MCEFHYLHHDAGRPPYADDAEMSPAPAARRARTGIGITLLPVLYQHGGFGGTPPRAEQRRFIRTRRVDRCACSNACAPRAATRGARARARAALAACGLAGAAWRRRSRASMRVDAAAPVHIHIAEQTAEVDALPRLERPAAGRMAARPCARRCALVPRARDAHDRRRRPRAPPRAARSRACAPPPRPISATASSTARALARRGGPLGRGLGQPCLRRRGGGTDAARIQPAPRSCASATCSPMRATLRRDRDAGWRPWPAARRRRRRESRASRVGQQADFVVLDAAHPAHGRAARRRDAVGTRLRQPSTQSRSMMSTGRRRAVSAGQRHDQREADARCVDRAALVPRRALMTHSTSLD